MAIYLVTGAAGFIGSSLIRELLARGEHVRALDNFETGKPENIADVVDRIEFHEIDIRDFSGLLRLCEGVEFILHQAALPSVPLSISDPMRSHDININGTVNVLMAARQAKVKRVVYAASSAVYGESPASPKQEDMLPDPISPYAVQKLTGEMYMRSFARVYSLETVCLRYFNIFGPRQDPGSPYSGVLARFIAAMLRNKPLTIFGDGEQTRDFTYVDNAVAANLQAAVAPSKTTAGEYFNVGTGQRVSLNTVVELLRGITDYSRPVNYGPPRSGDIRHSQADISKARAAFGYSPDVTLKDGLSRTVEWYKSRLPALPHLSNGLSNDPE